jgi:glycogen operon protein
MNDNLSWNGGVEGETDDPSINALRIKQIRNFLLLTLLSVGTPMICMGDELRRTQRGNNNPYCQDNEISWFDWGLLQKNGAIFRFVKLLIQGRLLRDMAKSRYSMSLNQLLKTAEIKWHGVRLGQPDWSSHSHSIAFYVRSLSGEMAHYFIINAYQEPLAFELPVPDSDRPWRRWIDTSLDSPGDIYPWNQAPAVESKEYFVGANTIVVLINVL